MTTDTEKLLIKILSNWCPLLDFITFVLVKITGRSCKHWLTDWGTNRNRSSSLHNEKKKKEKKNGAVTDSNRGANEWKFAFLVKLSYYSSQIKLRDSMMAIGIADCFIKRIQSLNLTNKELFYTRLRDEKRNRVKMETSGRKFQFILEWLHVLWTNLVMHSNAKCFKTH